MEVGPDSSMPTYRGGLGLLAGETLQADASQQFRRSFLFGDFATAPGSYPKLGECGFVGQIHVD
jgi:hypothetical protein